MKKPVMRVVNPMIFSTKIQVKKKCPNQSEYVKEVEIMVVCAPLLIVINYV